VLQREIGFPDDWSVDSKTSSKALQSGDDGSHVESSIQKKNIESRRGECFSIVCLTVYRAYPFLHFSFSFSHLMLSVPCGRLS